MNLVCAPLIGKPYGDQVGDESKLVAATLNCSGQQGGFRSEPGEHLSVMMNGVRRLTPTECERLQGFPDGWTCLCQPLDRYDSNLCKCPDGARYKALGNAVTVNVVEWIGKRLMRASVVK